MDHSPPGSSVHGDSSEKNTGVGCHTLLRGVFPTQGLNPCLPHCKRVSNHLNHQGSPFAGVIKQKPCFGVRKSFLHLKYAFTGIFTYIYFEVRLRFNMWFVFVLNSFSLKAYVYFQTHHFILRTLVKAGYKCSGSIDLASESLNKTCHTIY